MDFEANGGGDTPESVNQALHEAVTGMSWSQQDDTYRGVFLVGDATLATFPANPTPQYATNAHISFASLNQLITQVSWIRFLSPDGEPTRTTEQSASKGMGD